jgi:hypothetical protein
MPPISRHHLHAASMIAGALFLLAGIVLFWIAGSFQGYIGALLLMAIGALGFVAARELKRSERIAPPAPQDAL